jgi:L-alanine-DL-glutamate epimerase-like enolase superfamily enzyme
MKITHIDTYRVRAPLHPNRWLSPEYAAIDWLWEEEPITIIRVRTDAGIDGLGVELDEEALRSFAVE